MAKQQPQHIVSLEIDNFKRIKAVRIDTDGMPIVQITGRNAQGKSSIIDAIESALGGKKHTPAEPIRRGEKSASVIVTTDQLVVSREFVGDKSFVTVKAKDGGRFSNPQEILDRLWNSLTFDPLVFMRMKPAEQRQSLMHICGYDPSELDRRRENLYDERRLVNRSVESLKATIAGTHVPADPGEPNDLTDLFRRHEEHSLLVASRRGLESTILVAERAIATKKAAVASLLNEIDTLERQLKADRELQAQPLPAAPDQTELANAQQHNAAVAEFRSAKAKLADRQEMLERDEKKAKDLTNRIEAIDDEKAKAMQAAKFPIEGLSLTADGVTFNGIPLEQASQAEQLRVSAAIAIAMNSELRVMLVRDGSLLDSDALAQLERMAREANAQVFIERVADAGQGVGVVIEDGEVVAAKSDQPSE